MPEPVYALIRVTDCNDGGPGRIRSGMRKEGCPAGTGLLQAETIFSLPGSSWSALREAGPPVVLLSRYTGQD